ncbi:MAG TPA: tyrosine-type recombinase/integrase [Clostridia bacterium]|nr:tyrosine-type recombinase/integrase [Clostridia bacterium]
MKVKEFGDKWRIDYWDYTTTPRTKRGKKWSKKYVPTKREAQKRADEFMEQVNERNNSPKFCSTDGDTFASLVKLYRDKVLPHLKNSTRLHYEFFLETYLIPEFGATRITKIRRIKVQDFINARKKLAPKTVKNLHACFRAILNEGKRWSLLGDNPAVGVRLPRISRNKQQRTMLAPAEIRSLIEALPWPTNALVTLMVNGSLRFGEVAALRWKRILKDRIEIRERVYEGEFDDTKTESGDRDVPLNGAMKKWFETAWKLTKRRKPDDLVFCARNGSPISRRNMLNRQLKPTLRELNLPRCTFHNLRHLHSSLSMRTGASPEVTRDNMGHSEVDVTQNIYTGSWWEQRAAAVEGIEALIWGSTDTAVAQKSSKTSNSNEQ